MRKKAKKYWSCPCGTRNERIKQKCANPDCKRSRPKPRVAAHAKTLRDDPYEFYCRINEQIHDVWDESCAVCGKPKAKERRHDRDHGHLQGDLSYGKPRGLACVSCNLLMPRELTAQRAQLVADYLTRVDDFYRKQAV